MRTPALALLLALALLAVAAYAQNTQNQTYFKAWVPSITITGSEASPTPCSSWCPLPRPGEVLGKDCSYTVSSSSGIRLASWFVMGLNLNYTVDTGFPRTDKAQRALGASGVAAQWGDPNPLQTYYKVQGDISFNAPTGWQYRVDTYTYTCRYYNASNASQLLRTVTFSKSFVTEFQPTGWTSGNKSCALASFDQSAEANYTCTLSVPWYGKNTVSPSDFGADYWALNVMPKNDSLANYFGTYSMRITHQCASGPDGAIRFFIMSGLIPRVYNINWDETTANVYMNDSYFNYVWYIVNGKPSIGIIKDLGGGGARPLASVYPETKLKWTFGDKSGTVNAAPDNGVFTISTTGIPFRFDADLHALPPMWGDLLVVAPRATVPHIEVKTFSLVLENGSWNVYIGYDPKTCKRKNATRIEVALSPDDLQKAGPGKSCRSNAALTEVVWRATGSFTSSESVIAHIYKKVSDTCWAFAVAYVVPVPQGKASAYVDGVYIGSNAAVGFWYFPAGGISKAMLSAAFDLTFMGAKGRIIPGTEGIEIVPGTDIQNDIVNKPTSTLNKLKNLFTWFAVKSYGGWPYVYVALDKANASALDLLYGRALVPMASITFGETPYVYKTPIGNLAIPKEVIPNVYGRWYWYGDVKYYPDSFSTVVPQINSWTPSYTPSADVYLHRALEFWIGDGVGTVIRNIVKYNKDWINALVIDNYSDVSTCCWWSGPTAPPSVYNAVVRQDVEPGIMAPPPPPNITSLHWPPPHLRLPQGYLDKS
ncbi:MAG: hypothetical protein ACP5I3_08910 [Thermoproteus sp.]